MHKNLELLDRVYSDLISSNDESEELKKVLEAIDELQFSIEELIHKDECEMCNNKGYIETYNTELMADTIERCDDCQTIASDADALTKYNQENFV
jgi:hypothetical protein